MPEKRHQSRSAFAVSSGPLSQRMSSGARPGLGEDALEPGDRVVGVDAPRAADLQRLAGELVDDVQELQDAPVGGLVVLEVQRPHVIGALGPQPVGRHGRVAEALALAPAYGNAQALLAPQPLHALAVHRPALLAQLGVRAAVAPARPLLRELAQPRAQRAIVRRARTAGGAVSSGAARRSGTPDARTAPCGPSASGPPGAAGPGSPVSRRDLLQRVDLELLVGDDPLQLAFSRSSSFSRLTSSAFIPPYCARQR